MNGFISLKKSLRIYKKVLFRKENIIIFAQLSSKEFLIYCITSKNRRRSIEYTLLFNN